MYLPEHLVHQLDQGGLLHQFDPEKIDEKNCETHIFWSSFTIKINSNQRDKQTWKVQGCKCKSHKNPHGGLMW